MLALAPHRIPRPNLVRHLHLALAAHRLGGKGLDRRERCSRAVPRIIVLTTAIVAIASLSYHAVEKPIRYGTIGTHLNKKRIGVVASRPARRADRNQHLGCRSSRRCGDHSADEGRRERRTRDENRDPRGRLRPSGASQTSLPTQLPKRGYVVLRATAGGCPATGISKAYSSGEKFKHEDLCEGDPERTGLKNQEVPARARHLVEPLNQSAPGSGRTGNVLPLGSRAYRRAQQASFEERARVLTQPRSASRHRPDRAPRGRLRQTGIPRKRGTSSPGQTLLHRPDVVNAWNAFLARHKGPKVFSISIDHLVCHDAKSPCDDSLPNGETARPDGVHYSTRPGVASHRTSWGQPSHRSPRAGAYVVVGRERC